MIAATPALLLALLLAFALACAGGSPPSAPSSGSGLDSPSSPSALHAPDAPQDPQDPRARATGRDTQFPAGVAALRVGVAPSYPPIIFQAEGQIVGIEADFARRLAVRLDRPLQFEQYAFPDLIPALERGEIDVIMSGLSRTPEHEERVDFVSSYMETGQLALIRTRDIARFGRIQNIRRPGVRVGYQYGTTGEAYVASTLRRAESFGFDDVESALRSLRAERIDYFVHDAPTVWQLAGDLRNRDIHGLYRPLMKESLAWAVRPGNNELHRQLEATLTRWQREGLIDPIVQRWIPVRVTLR